MFGTISGGLPIIGDACTGVLAAHPQAGIYIVFKRTGDLSLPEHSPYELGEIQA